MRLIKRQALKGLPSRKNMTHAVAMEGQTDNTKGRGTLELFFPVTDSRDCTRLTFLLLYELLAVNREMEWME